MASETRGCTQSWKVEKTDGSEQGRESGAGPQVWRRSRKSAGKLQPRRETEPTRAGLRGGEAGAGLGEEPQTGRRGRV